MTKTFTSESTDGNLINFTTYSLVPNNRGVLIKEGRGVGEGGEGPTDNLNINKRGGSK